MIWLNRILCTMRKTFIIILVLSLSITSFSQGFIGDTRDKVKSKLGKYINQENITASFQETDSTVTLHLQDSKFKTADFIYEFNYNNVCVAEIKHACDTCIKKYFAEALSYKKYHWIQINSTTYASKYEGQLVIHTLSENGIFSLNIRKIDLPKYQYRQYLEHSGIHSRATKNDSW